MNQHPSNPLAEKRLLPAAALRQIVMPFVLLLIFAACACAAPETIQAGMPQGPSGARDFVQYWSGCRILQNGENIYDPRLMHETQQAAGFKWDEPVMTWIPPWYSTLLCPLMRGELADAAKLWQALNFAFLFTAAILFWKSVTDRRAEFAALLLISVMFMPAIDNMLSGQMGLLLTASLGTFAFFKSRGRDFAAGLVLAPLSFKPHLFVLLGLALFFDCFGRRNWRLFAGGLAGMTVLTLPLLIVHPAAFSQWLSAIGTSHYDTKVTTILEWQPDALVGKLRALTHWLDLPSAWIVAALPLCACLGMLAFMRGRWQSFSWKRHLAPLLCWSLLAAPYAWFSDQSVLLSVPVCLLAAAKEWKLPAQSFRRLLIMLIAAQCLLVLSQFAAAGAFWFPALMLLAWHYGMIFIERRINS